MEQRTSKMKFQFCVLDIQTRISPEPFHKLFLNKRVDLQTESCCGRRLFQCAHWWGEETQQMGNGCWQIIIKWPLVRSVVVVSQDILQTQFPICSNQNRRRTMSQCLDDDWWVDRHTDRQIHPGWIKIMAYWWAHCLQCRPTSATELKSALSGGQTSSRSSTG